MKTLTELNQEIKGKSQRLHDIFKEAGDNLDMAKVTTITGDNATKAREIKKLNDELSDLGKERDSLNELVAQRKAADEMLSSVEQKSIIKTEQPGAAGVKSIGRMLRESPAFKNKGLEVFLPDVEMKTLFETGAGWAPMSQRIPGYVAYPVIAPSVFNFIPQYTTNQHAIKYMLETTYTATNTVEKAEGAALGEAAFALTETTGIIEKVGAFVPVTDEQLEDEANVEQYLTDRLTLQVKNRAEKQSLEGTGVTPLMLGTKYLSSPNSQAKGADPVPDAIYKAMTLVRSVGFAEPSVMFINPNDWQDIRLLRTADGIYIFGNPTDSGPERIWGIPVCVTMAVTENTALVGDYARYSAMYWRKGIDIVISSGYDDYFIKGKQAVRATARGCMVHFREKAFALVTGI